jgi:hypothetical protein
VPRVTALVLGAVADDLDQLSLGDGEVHRLISVVMLCSLLLRRALYPASCARCGLRSFRASSKLSPMPAPGLLAACHHLEFGRAFLHVIPKPLDRGSEHRYWTRSQKPSPTCRFILWSCANDLRKSGSVVLGKLEAHRELLKPVRTEALLA